MLKKFLITFLVVAIVGAIALFYLDSKYLFIQVRGTSMSPTYENGDILVVERKENFAPGQLVLFKLPEAWKEAYKGNDANSMIKRIRLKEGDVLAWDGQAWYANGEMFSHLKTGECEVEPTEVTLGSGELFVTGDTFTDQTMDSREAFCLGLPYFVTEDLVEGSGEVARVL